MFVRMLRRPRHHRHGHERVSLQDDTNSGNNGSGDGDGSASPTEGQTEEPPTLVDTTGNVGIVVLQSNPSSVIDNPEHVNPASTNTEFTEASPRPEPNQQRPPSDSPTEPAVTLHPHPTTHPFLTSQIRTERQIRHRRQHTCTLLLIFLLFRLWIEAILQKDMGLIFLSIMGTTWTYRWWSSRRQEEDEYDRQIEENGQRSSDSRNAAVPTAGRRNEGTPDAASAFDPDLGLMSFQAQLALAILESQRQMFENGGYGGNDRSEIHSGPGVTEEAKGKWTKYEWGGEGCSEVKRLGSSSSMELLGEGCSNNSCQRVGSIGSNYGSVSSSPTNSMEEGDHPLHSSGLSNSELSASKLEEGLVLSLNEEEPSCSICLCEYEKGESVMRLPCNHLYHESCLDSWVTNHVRCPLCNYDLMEGFELPPRPAEQQQQNNAHDLFRRMIGARRASARSTRRQLATMLAAMEDSVV
eukprot:CCRYP_014744-RA/>CCRYP_014744-RA protein AED:0.28 eAED:0.28 QI:0/-1/0/1/-1/1/1/0/466